MNYRGKFNLTVLVSSAPDFNSREQGRSLVSLWRFHVLSINYDSGSDAAWTRVFCLFLASANLSDYCLMVGYNYLGS